jgi:hypothetical protein
MTADRHLYPALSPPALTARDLFERALEEVDRLGAQPRSESRRWCWEEERRGSMCDLAGLAGHDGHLLRRAGLHIATGPRHRNRKAAQLLAEATRFAWRSGQLDCRWPGEG